MKEQPLPSAVFEDGDLRISVEQGRQESRILVVFSGAALLFSGTPQEEFFRSTRDLEITRIFVVDKTVSYYSQSRINEKIYSELRKIFTKLAPAQIVTLGVSAGGLGAIIFAKLLGAQACVVLSPLFTVHSEQLGGPPVYPPANLARISDIKSAGEYISSSRTYMILSGTVGVDLVHASYIARLADGFACVEMADHMIAKFVIAAEAFRPLIEKAFEPSSHASRSYVALLQRALPTRFIDRLACRQLVEMINGLPNLEAIWPRLEPTRAAWAISAINDWLLREEGEREQWRDQYRRIAEALRARDNGVVWQDSD